jgi:hypothetical protein
MRRDEALAALSTITETERAMRRQTLRQTLAPTLVTWGIVWLIGYLADFVLSRRVASLLWLVLVSAGLLVTFGANLRYGRRVRSPFGLRLALSWIAGSAYLVLWSMLLFPRDPLIADFVLVTAIMAGYVLLGIWWIRSLAVIGGFVTLVALAGYLAGPSVFPLVVGCAGGGALLVGGIRLWRSS